MNNNTIFEKKGNTINQKFVYSIPTKIYFGEDQLENLVPELKQFGNRVLLAVLLNALDFTKR
jgi:regulatory protein YycH of two-component signal transduction system YycFG